MRCCFFFSMASWNRNKQFWLVYVNSMIQTWAQPMSTSSYSDRKAQFTNGRCYQSTLRASFPIYVCVCVCACQTTPALLLFSVAHPSFFFAEFLWAIVFWSAISFHQHEMDSQISLVIFNKKPWDAQQKSAPHDTCGFSQRVHGGARQQPPFAGYTRECEDMNQFETDLSCSKTSNLGRLLQPYNNI